MSIVLKGTEKSGGAGEVAKSRKLLSALRALVPPPVAGVARPYIPSDSKHFAYALLVLAGCPNAEACRQVGVSVKAAEKWRGALRAAGRAYWGCDREYTFIARFCLDEELRREVAPKKAPEADSVAC